MHHSQPHLMPPHWSGKPVEMVTNNATADTTTDDTVAYEVFAANGGSQPHLLPASHPYFDRFRKPYPTR